MNSRTHFRLVVLYVMVGALLLVLVGRMWTLQVLEGDHYRDIAAQNRMRDIVVPALRGMILDDRGRPLARNTSSLVVSVDRTTLSRQDDGGEAVLRRLANVLGMSQEEIDKRTRLCSPTVQRPCWPGSPYQPIPVEDHADPKRALQIMERQEDFPGVTAQIQPVRAYPEPEGASAVQTLGYLQPVTQEELDKREGLKVTGYSGVDLVGRDGLEAQYDKALRGEAGYRRVLVDAQGRVTGIAEKKEPVPGNHLVTSIDAGVQGAAEKALEEGIKAARKGGRPADSGAAVVMDVRTGRMVAMASFPSYDPSVWTGGISQKKYDELLGEKNNSPLISRVTQGQGPPGSTFKVSSMAAAVKAGYDLHGTYNCPGSYMVGSRAFNNFQGANLGSMNLHTALVKSCDTIFYKFAHEMWLRNGGRNAPPDAKNPMVEMARGFGFDARTGIDLPSESSGRIPDAPWKRQYWEATREANCRGAKEGYPDVAKTDPGRAAYLKAIAAENCVEGYVWRAGDAANLSIGQGNVLVTPLQLVRAYAAIANGGKLYTPRIGVAVVRPDGSVAERIDPPEPARVPIDEKVLAYMRKALAEVPTDGTAGGAFAGFDLKRVAVAGKTGTAERYGNADMSWFASFGPVKSPRYAVVAMVSQGGFGAQTAAPIVRKVWEAMYGTKDSKPILEDGRLPTDIPKLPGSETAP
ncbi:penicillin-binding protein 2 [Actinomadura livida]|uniref:Penicillin-binding protein 2 n=1 Tax=Actinomadura livida TaxID=79909 RepID=A0A7W7IBQ7_9ACTN|nr:MULTISPECIES: penicillin-binding protein 2 [Actinomadura]MBB4773823.1 penicillin-binding protein 2 [Actinomadura catellatispora]GGU10968.1 penicillin-binding protein 2 [Actinomadura livida]